MKSDSVSTTDKIERSFALARADKPAYNELYPLLEALFTIQARMKDSIRLDPPAVDPQLVETNWGKGFPLIMRWDFPIDIDAAESILFQMKGHIPEGNRQMTSAHAALSQALVKYPDQKGDLWKSFLQHEWEPWEEWVDTKEVDVATLLFLARSCIRPSMERVAEDLLIKNPIPKNWLKGYCPVCGSLPSLLFLEEEGERKACCSWCGTKWGMHRLQCPSCDNRLHESLGYLFIEAEPRYRIQYCRLCKNYFKLIDTRELLEPPFFPLEEWVTLHLDLLAQREGWKQPLSPSAVVYGDGRNELQ